MDPAVRDDNMQLDEFAAEYRNLIESGKQGALLAKCMSLYDNQVTDGTICFNKTRDNFYEKDNTEKEASIPNPLDGSSITIHDISGLYPGKNQITFGDIRNHRDLSSYSFNPTTFLDDWLDFRTSIGTLKKDNEGNIDVSGSEMLKKYEDEYEKTIYEEHKKLLKRRNDLDNKMRDLYGATGDVDLNLDSSVYSTMLFTVMTTSLLYYLFIKM